MSVAMDRGLEMLAADLERMRRWEPLYAALAALPFRLRLIVEMRWGLGEERPLTLDEVGAALFLSRERVRQLERQALDLLAVLLAPVHDELLEAYAA